MLESPFWSLPPSPNRVSEILSMLSKEIMDDFVTSLCQKIKPGGVDYMVQNTPAAVGREAPGQGEGTQNMHQRH